MDTRESRKENLDPVASATCHIQSVPPEIVIQILAYALTSPHDIHIRTRSARRLLRRSINPPALLSSLSALLVCKRFHVLGYPMIFKRNRIVFSSVNGQSPGLLLQDRIDMATQRHNRICSQYCDSTTCVYLHQWSKTKVRDWLTDIDIVVCPPIKAHVEVISKLTSLERLTLDIDLRFDPVTGLPNITFTNPTARQPSLPSANHWIFSFFTNVRQVPVLNLRVPKEGDARISANSQRRNSYLFFAMWLVQRNNAWTPRQSAEECRESFKAITNIILYDWSWLPKFT